MRTINWRILRQLQCRWACAGRQLVLLVPIKAPSLPLHAQLAHFTPIAVPFAVRRTAIGAFCTNCRTIRRMPNANWRISHLLLHQRLTVRRAPAAPTCKSTQRFLLPEPLPWIEQPPVPSGSAGLLFFTPPAKKKPPVRIQGFAGGFVGAIRSVVAFGSALIGTSRRSRSFALLSA